MAHDIPSSLDYFFLLYFSHTFLSSFRPHKHTVFHHRIYDLPSHFRSSKLAPSSSVLAPTPPSILCTYTRSLKPSSLLNNPPSIEPSSRIDPNPPPSPFATPASPSPCRPSYPSRLLLQTRRPFFHQKHTHPNQLLCSVAPATISPRRSSSTIMSTPTFAPINCLP